jgi:hypothetical protein
MPANLPSKTRVPSSHTRVIPNEVRDPYLPSGFPGAPPLRFSRVGLALNAPSSIMAVAVAFRCHPDGAKRRGTSLRFPNTATPPIP